MARKILVSLVSDQTIPNIIFIKSMKDEFYQYWFITTEQMEGKEKDGTYNLAKSKSDWIIETCNIKSRSFKIFVVEDDLNDIQLKLQMKFSKNEENITLLNMTCGTKMMSLGAFLFFNDFAQEIYYKPIAKKYFKSIRHDNSIEDHNLNIREYLSGYGIKFKEKVCLKLFEYVKSFFEYFISESYNEKLLESLRIHYRGKKRIKIDEVESFIEETLADVGKQIPYLSKFLKDIKFELIDDGYLKKSELEFLTGGWFEEFVFYSIKGRNKLSDEFIKIGVLLEKSDITNENDLDVVIVRDNKFIVIECKTAMKIDGKVSQLFNETIYKAAALKKNFGLFVDSYLFTLEDISMNDYLGKAKVLGINAIDRNQILDKTKFETMLDQI